MVIRPSTEAECRKRAKMEAYVTGAPMTAQVGKPSPAQIPRMVAVGGQVTPFSGRVFRPLTHPRRAVGLEFYVSEEGGPIETE